MVLRPPCDQIRHRVAATVVVGEAVVGATVVHQVAGAAAVATDARDRAPGIGGVYSCFIGLLFS